MRLLLHASNPEGLLMLRAATVAGVLPSATDRVVVFDSRTPGGRAVAEALEAGAPLGAADTVLDLAGRTDAWAVLHFLAPSVVVLDAAAPANAQRLARAVPQARLVLLDSGSAQFCPTPTDFSRDALERITDLVHAEIVPGLEPVLLRERTVRRHTVPWAAVNEAAAGWAAATTLPRRLASLLAQRVRLLFVIGTDLPELKEKQEAEAARLAARLASAALDTGADVIVHLPTPTGERAQEARLATAAAAEGLACAHLPAHLPAAVAHALLSPRLTVSVDAPLLLALRSHTEHRVQSVATGRLLPRLASATDPARPRLALNDAALRRGIPLPLEEGDGPSSSLLQRVIDAVAFAVAPSRLAALRPLATRTLLGETALRSAYVPSSRIKELGLRDDPLPAPAPREPSASPRRPIPPVPHPGQRRIRRPGLVGWLHRSGRRA